MEAKPYALAAGVRAIDAQLKRLNLPGKAMQVEDAPGAFQVRYELTGHPLVSVMIPNKDHIDDLDRCLKSLYANAGYDNFEVLVIEITLNSRKHSPTTKPCRSVTPTAGW